MTDEQRVLLDRLANAGHLIALGKDGSVAIGAALTDLAARDRRVAELEARLKEALDYIGTLPYGQDWLAERQIPCPMSTLDALLAQARREALEGGIAAANILIAMHAKAAKRADAAGNEDAESFICGLRDGATGVRSELLKLAREGKP